MTSVLPFLAAWFMSAFAASSVVTTSAWPAWQAASSGVQPPRCWPGSRRRSRRAARDDLACGHCSRRSKQRRAAIVAGVVHVGVRSEQLRDDLGWPAVRRRDQRRVAIGWAGPPRRSQRSASRRSRCGPSGRRYSGVAPVSRARFTSAFAASSGVVTTSAWPFRQAMYRGVLPPPSVFGSFTSAPSASSAATSAARPCRAASVSGVPPAASPLAPTPCFCARAARDAVASSRSICSLARSATVYHTTLGRQRPTASRCRPPPPAATHSRYLSACARRCRGSRPTTAS